jgi:hypothetical protein
MGLEVILFTAIGAAVPKAVDWLYKKWIFRKVPKAAREPLKAILTSAAKSAATSALKEFNRDQPPPLPRGKK